MDIPAPEDGEPAAFARGPDATQALLYRRYLSALLLLCECAPYVDDADYLARLDALLEEACEHYPLQWRAEGVYRELGPLPS